MTIRELTSVHLWLDVNALDARETLQSVHVNLVKVMEAILAGL